MGINEKTGEVFSVAAENAQVAGCTVSKAVAEVAGGYVAHFSLAAGTDISRRLIPRLKSGSSFQARAWRSRWTDANGRSKRAVLLR